MRRGELIAGVGEMKRVCVCACVCKETRETEAGKETRTNNDRAGSARVRFLIDLDFVQKKHTKKKIETDTKK